MKISYVTISNALDIHSWSGLEFHIAKALEAQSADIDYISNLEVKQNLEIKLKRIFYKLNGLQLDPLREPFVVNHFCKLIKSRLKKDTDIIFSTGSVATAMLNTNKPKVIYSDATFADLIKTYFSRFCSETIKKGHVLEQTALESAKLIIYSSDWAAQSAVSDYQIDPRKIKVVPFGANLVGERKLSDIEQIVKKRSKKECNLLFLGVEWERKGGEMAIKVAEKLNKLGIITNLHIVGIKDTASLKLPSFVINHGFISKGTAEGNRKLNKLFQNSHFLILPSKADCTPVVYSEANSFGLPCITTNVGGIPSIIKDNINGKMFDLTESADDYADFIANKFLNMDSYFDLALSSFNEYEVRLNWGVSGKKIYNLLSDI
jgi:glycosyltransferase involved in cell wall biosynthesis